MTVLLLEDELEIANQLEALLPQLPFSIDIVAHFTTVSEAVHWLSTQAPPDLILADVLLQDGLSFEIFDQLQLTTPVIYFTSYLEYALDAFDSHVIDYIIKPISAAKLAHSLVKFARITQYYLPSAGPSKTDYADMLTVSKGAKLQSIPTSLIRYAYRCQQQVYLRTLEQTYLFNKTLEELEQGLNPALFYRANRQYLIHRRSIVKLEFLPARKLGIQLEPPLEELVVVSKAKATDFLQWGGFKGL